jgi:hypothetical protein
MDSKKILEKVRGESAKTKISLYLSKALIEEFKEACGDIPPSRIVEALLKDFLQSVKTQEKIPDTPKGPLKKR